MRVRELVPGVQEGRYFRAALAGRSVFFTNAVRGVVLIAKRDGAVVPSDARTEEVAQRSWPPG